MATRIRGGTLGEQAAGEAEGERCFADAGGTGDEPGMVKAAGGDGAIELGGGAASWPIGSEAARGSGGGMGRL